MKFPLALAALILALPVASHAQNAAAAEPDPQARELIALSKQRWAWMAEKNIVALSGLFDPKAIFGT